jgi:hypothetical protein
VNGDVPLAVTEMVLVWPLGIDAGEAIGTDALGGTQAATVTVAAGLSAGGAHWPVTRTQYEVVLVGLTVTDELVAPPIGLAVFPELPVNH